MQGAIRKVSNRMRDWAWCFWHLLQGGGCEDGGGVRPKEDPCKRSEGNVRVRQRQSTREACS